jgi:hypothetical protein
MFFLGAKAHLRAESMSELKLRAPSETIRSEPATVGGRYMNEGLGARSLHGD